MMSQLRDSTRTRFVTAFVAALLAVSACVDAPSAPEGQAASNADLGFVPVFSLVGPSGLLANARQADALGEAFDLVDRFRFVVRRASNNSVVLDTVIIVTPGEDVYDFAFGVAAGPNEEFSVTLTALQGETELFQAPNIRVRATPPAAANDGGGPAPTNVAMQYSGPGATATSVQVAPGQLLLAPGGSGALTGDVQDQDGNSVADVPLAWSSSNPSVARVAGGSVTAVSHGIAEVTVTTPTGLEAGAAVWVVDGVLAYVAGGVVMTSSPAGGAADVAGGDGGASAPAWSPDGGDLFFAEGGSVRRAGGDEALAEGGWPSVSPTGRYLAVENAGVVHFVNDDGSRSAPGPAGTTPVWAGQDALLVGGGSVESVNTDGTGRSTIAGGAASLPALGPEGQVAVVDAGELSVVGVGVVAAGVAGRASFSPSGFWLVYPDGSGLSVVPAGGSHAALSLPGFGGATDPAFKPTGMLAGTGAPGLTGFDPDPPVPGQVVMLVGSGFDVLIPGNNRVFWPGADGPVETPGEAATGTTLTTRMPRSVSAGKVRVETRDGVAMLDFVPSLGTIEVHATTTDGTPVPGVEGIVTLDGEEVARATTDEAGELLFAGLVPGSYVLTLRAPEGFKLIGLASAAVEVTTAASVVNAVVRPLVRSATASPGEPTLAVGAQVAVTIDARDVNGAPISSFESTFWGAGTTHLAAGGAGLAGVIAGVHPSAATNDAQYNVRLGEQLFTFSATVTSHIGGTVVAPAEGGLQGAGLVANTPVGNADVSLSGPGVTRSTETDGEGRYRFDGLLAGTYEIEVSPQDGLPGASRTVALDQAHPTGTADFTLSATGTRRDGDVVIYKDYDPWFGDKKNELTLQAAPFNFVKDVDYFVRHTSELQSGIPAETSIIILGSASNGSSPVTNVNHPAAQANLEAWVSGGGWLVAHVGDNVYNDGFVIPGLTGIADDNNQCTKETLQLEDHPFIRGPDGLLGTADDLTSPLGNLSSCSDNHGSVEGILPPDALVILREAGGSQRATYAAYAYGAGYVVVTTLTLEFSGHDPKTLRNHLWWTIMGGEAAAPVTPIQAPALVAPPLVTRRSDDPPGRGR